MRPEREFMAKVTSEWVSTADRLPSVSPRHEGEREEGWLSYVSAPYLVITENGEQDSAQLYVHDDGTALWISSFQDNEPDVMYWLDHHVEIVTEG